MLGKTDWGMVGAIATIVALGVTVLGGAVKGFLSRRRAIAAQEPRIEFSDIHFARPGQHSRHAYRYAFGVRVSNTGSGPARHLVWGFADEREEWFAEMVHRDVLGPLETTEDWSGLRGEDQSTDPDETEALAFYDRCLVFAECWDSRDKHYVFFPFGGGRAKDGHGGHFKLRQTIAVPSRGEIRRSLGGGELDRAFAEQKRRGMRRRK